MNRVKLCAGQKQIARVNEVGSVIEESMPELHFASVWKRIFVQHLLYENTFKLHENEPVGRTRFHMNGISWRLVLLQRQETVALDPSKSTHNNSITVFTKSLLTSHSDNHVLRCNIFNYLSQHILWYTSVFTDLQRSSNINIFSLFVSYIFCIFFRPFIFKRFIFRIETLHLQDVHDGN